LRRIPYLNGGLFDIHELEQPNRYGERIEVPDDAFKQVFDCFDEYDWHLDERSLKAAHTPSGRFGAEFYRPPVGSRIICGRRR
jgi:hypothetical protein